MQGSDDRLTSVQASREFALKVGQRCTLKIWENLYHEIHHEPEQEQVLAYLLDWLSKRIMANE
jgi:alpha-beta hydrolase superfamily lysophospholipase